MEIEKTDRNPERLRLAIKLRIPIGNVLNSRFMTVYVVLKNIPDGKPARARPNESTPKL
jgi:hypothetical protein